MRCYDDLCLISLWNAVVANKAWPLVAADLQWFVERGNGKKMYMDEVSISWRPLSFLVSQLKYRTYL
jgi:hypothetical protein